MCNWFIERPIDKFERRWGYDAGYVREIARDCSLGALAPLQALQRVGSFRKHVPVDVYYAAKIVASLAADCGPCLQLTVSMGEAAGVPPTLIRDVVAGNREALSADVCLGFDFARAAIARDGSGAEIRASVLQKWGREGLHLAGLWYRRGASISRSQIRYRTRTRVFTAACRRREFGGKAAYYSMTVSNSA